MLSDEADVSYRLSSAYDPGQERGLAWDGPELGIDWRVSDPILSPRDGQNPTLRELTRELPDW